MLNHLIGLLLIGSVCGFPSIETGSLSLEPTYSFYKREEWRALPSTDTRPLKTPVEYVVIHHTYLPAACNTTEKCGAAMRSMQKYHMGLDWGDIGYNFCVGSEGGAYEGRGWNVVGIHAGKANGVSVGICLIGDWRTTSTPKVQLATTKRLIATGVAQGIVSKDYKLIGHMQVMATECPGTVLMNEIKKWDHFVDEFNDNRTVSSAQN